MSERQDQDKPLNAEALLSTGEAVASRSLLVEHWLALTKRILPAMAVEHRWPIVRDHCFMRVCLDEAFGAPWSDTIARPAIRGMTEAQVEAAVAVAEAIVVRPSLLVALNRKSLQGRRAKRARDEAGLED